MSHLEGFNRYWSEKELVLAPLVIVAAFLCIQHFPKPGLKSKPTQPVVASQ